jgi:hypothetical protein
MFNKMAYIRSLLIKCYVTYTIKEIYIYNSHDNPVDWDSTGCQIQSQFRYRSQEIIFLPQDTDCLWELPSHVSNENHSHVLVNKATIA